LNIHKNDFRTKADLIKRKYIHVLVPEELLKDFDDFIEGKYANRTAALHEAMRQFMKEA
jgi:metal-responsive CopG/Arc/MetJ family transcriptional regulator